MVKKKTDQKPHDSISHDSISHDSISHDNLEVNELELVDEPGHADEALRLELRELEQQLEQSRNQANEYLDGWQRARAEFANYKKRMERDQADAYRNAAGTIFKRYLAVMDDLERALRNRPAGEEGRVWAEGIELIYRKLAAMLESDGVTRMKTEGEMFDPNLHEAILTEDTDLYESGRITEVLQQGYMLGDRVLRPAMVRVAR